MSVTRKRLEDRLERTLQPGEIVEVPGVEPLPVVTAGTSGAAQDPMPPSVDDDVRAAVRAAIAKAWALRPSRDVPCGRSWGLGRQAIVKLFEEAVDGD